MEAAFAVLPQGSPSVNMVMSTFVLFALLSQDIVRKFPSTEISNLAAMRIVSSVRYPAQSSASASCEEPGTSASCVTKEPPEFPMPARRVSHALDVVKDSCATAGPASHQPAGTVAAASGYQAASPLAASGPQPATLAATAATKSEACKEAPTDLKGDGNMWLQKDQAVTSKAIDVFFCGYSIWLGQFSCQPLRGTHFCNIHTPLFNFKGMLEIVNNLIF